MKTAHIMIGVAGSGKSTFTLSHMNENDIYVNADSIRKELNGDRKDHSNETSVWKSVDKKIQNAIRKNKNIWIDNTNRSRKRRSNLYQDLKRKGYYIISHFFVLPFKEILDHNENRPYNEKLSYDILKKQFITMEPPIIGIDTDKIAIGTVDINDESDVINWIINFCSEDDSKNEYYHTILNKKADSLYHSESIKEHIDSCIKSSPNNEIKELSLFHDLGKLMTFFNNGKDHYYNHEILSSYLYFAYMTYHGLEVNSEMLKMIRWHMIPFSNSNGVFPKKLANREMLDQSTIDKIMYFNKIDKENSIK